MMKNAVGRDIPEYIDGYGRIRPFEGAWANMGETVRTAVRVKNVRPGAIKMLSSLEEAIGKCGLRDGMTVSFHHHLRNGDHVLNMVLDAAARHGLKDLKVAASSIFPVHAPLIEHIREGVVAGLYTSYISGPVAQAVSRGILPRPLIMHTHGGRARAIEAGDLHIDAAFIAAPACDCYGNINGVQGVSACGVLGYPVADAHYADKTVAVTDCIVPYPACPIEISQEYIDYIVPVERIGDVEGIVSGTTRVTEDQEGLRIAELASRVIEASGLLEDGFSFQTGAGGISLAVAVYIKELMKKKGIRGSFASGGITGYMVEMLEEGLFSALLDTQCFDLRAVESLQKNRNHLRMSAGMYGNPHNKGAVVNNLDVMVLGATEIDTQFNVNVTTDSNGILMGGSGGHSDTAAGSKLAVVVTKLVKKRYPIVVDSVTTITTPGETVDVVVTDHGIAVNPGRQDLLVRLKGSGLPIVTIEELKASAEEITGPPPRAKFGDRIVALLEYRDGTVIDTVREVKL